jgi:hypothetical protein
LYSAALICFDQFSALGTGAPRAARRVDVVDGAGDVLCRPEGLELRDPGVHLDRCFGVGGVLEHHLDAVERHFLEVLADDQVGRDQTGVAVGDILADRLVHVAVRVARQQHGVRVLRAPRHGVAGEDVLGNCLAEKALRRDDLDLAAGDVGFIDHAAHAAEMVDVRM